MPCSLKRRLAATSRVAGLSFLGSIGDLAMP